MKHCLPWMRHCCYGSNIGTSNGGSTGCRLASLSAPLTLAPAAFAALDASLKALLTILAAEAAALDAETALSAALDASVTA
ncbi:hypothetical protein ACYATO_00100 [Lactobacillaceae bacterium Melli_B3]